MNEKATQFANEAIAQTENTAATCVSMMRRALEINDVGLACHAAAELVNAVGDAFTCDALAVGRLPYYRFRCPPLGTAITQVCIEILGV